MASAVLRPRSFSLAATRRRFPDALAPDIRTRSRPVHFAGTRRYSAALMVKAEAAAPPGLA